MAGHSSTLRHANVQRPVQDDWRTAMAFLCRRCPEKNTMAAILALHEALFQPDSLVLPLSPTLRPSRELLEQPLVADHGILGSNTTTEGSLGRSHPGIP